MSLAHALSFASLTLIEEVLELNDTIAPCFIAVSFSGRRMSNKNL